MKMTKLPIYIPIPNSISLQKVIEENINMHFLIAK